MGTLRDRVNKLTVADIRKMKKAMEIVPTTMPMISRNITFTLEEGVEGSLTMGGYCVSASDADTGAMIAKIHPIAFIQIILND